MAAKKERPLLPPGQPAPPFVLPGLDGAKQSLASLLRNGPVVLAFLKVTCPVCQFTFPYLERIYRGSGLNVIAISQDDASDTREFLAEAQCTFPALIDDEDTYPVSTAYSLSHVPTIYEIEPTGVISASWTGWVKADMESLAQRWSVPLLHPGEVVPVFKPG